MSNETEKKTTWLITAWNWYSTWCAIVVTAVIVLALFVKAFGS